MKELLVLRHAKSDHGNHALRDHDRPLSERGRKNARRMGRHLAKSQLIPEVILCSSSTRTTETCALLAESAEMHPKIEFIEQLYLASNSCMMMVASQRAMNSECVMLIGHNPGCEDMLQALDLGMHEMPTCTLARIGLEIDDWLELEGSCKANLMQLTLVSEIEED